MDSGVGAPSWYSGLSDGGAAGSGEPQKLVNPCAGEKNLWSTCLGAARFPVLLQSLEHTSVPQPPRHVGRKAEDSGSVLHVCFYEKAGLQNGSVTSTVTQLVTWLARLWSRVENPELEPRSLASFKQPCGGTMLVHEGLICRLNTLCLQECPGKAPQPRLPAPCQDLMSQPFRCRFQNQTPGTSAVDLNRQIFIKCLTAVIIIICDRHHPGP